MNNTRNSYGVKDAINSYRIINGKTYAQWTDFASMEECKKENPEYHFIQRKQPDGTIRIYKEV